MVQIEGTYELQSQENFKEYLLSLGVNEEMATKAADSIEKIVISSVGSDKITVSHSGVSLTLPLNKELEHTLGSHTLYTTASINGDEVTFKTKFTADGALSEEKVYKITDGGLTSTMTNTKGAKAVRKYKRV